MKFVYAMPVAWYLAIDEARRDVLAHTTTLRLPAQDAPRAEEYLLDLNGTLHVCAKGGVALCSWLNDR